MRIVFSSSNTWGGWFIRALTASKWNHVEVLFDDGTVIGAMTYGVEKTTMFQREDSKYTRALMVCSIDLPNEEAARRFAEEQIGKPYDWGGCFATILRGPWQTADKWFCSELVARICEIGGNPIVSRLHDVARVTPHRVEWAPQLKIAEHKRYVNRPRFFWIW
jgi:uncharacterized protein YycO